MIWDDHVNYAVVAYTNVSDRTVSCLIIINIFKKNLLAAVSYLVGYLISLFSICVPIACDSFQNLNLIIESIKIEMYAVYMLHLVKMQTTIWCGFECLNSVK